MVPEKVNFFKIYDFYNPFSASCVSSLSESGSGICNKIKYKVRCINNLMQFLKQ